MDDDDDFEEYGAEADELDETGIDLGEVVLVSTTQGLEIGVLMDTFDEGVWIKSTHRMQKVKTAVSVKEKAALLCEVEQLTTRELRGYCRENGVRWTFNKKREFLVDFVFEDILKDREAKSTQDLLVKLNRPISMFIPPQHVTRVVSYDEWQEERTLRDTAADLVELSVDTD
jgi:hypothetical protein